MNNRPDASVNNRFETVANLLQTTRPAVFSTLSMTLLWIMGFPDITLAVPSPLTAPVALAAPSTVPDALDTLIQQGRSLYQTGNFAEAVQLWQQALAMPNLDRLHQALIWSYLTACYQQMGQWEQATQAIATSTRFLTTATQADEPVPAELQAQVATTQGHLQLAQGQGTEALATWQRAEALYRTTNDIKGQTGSRLNQVRALQQLGLYRRARETLEQLQQDLQTQPDPQLKVMGLRELGNTLRVVGDLARSRQVLLQSLSTAEAAQLTSEVPTTLLSLGNTARVQGDTAAAQTYYQQAIAQATTAATKLSAQISAFSLLVETEQWQEVRSQFAQLQTILNQLPPSQTATYARIQLAQSLLPEAIPDSQTSQTITELTPLIPDLADILAGAVVQARQLKDPRAESYALGYLGRLYEKTQQWRSAKTLTQEALQFAQAANAGDIAYQWQWQLGRLQTAEGDTAAAIAAYTEAVNTLKQLRSDLIATNLDVRFSFRNNVEPIYRQLVTLLLGKSGEQPSQTDLKQARQVIEDLQLAELENYFREACLETRPVQVDQIDAQAAVVYPIVLGDRLAIILSLPHQPLRYYATFMPQSEIQQAIDKLRQAMRRTSFPSEYLSASQRVYDLLIRPLAPDLQASGTKTLVFTLDTAIQNLPIAALYDGQHYLIERYNLAITPGLRLLAPQPLNKRGLTALIGGVSEATQGFSALPAVAQEVSHVETEISSQVLLNQAFTRTQLQRQINARPFSIVHLATHGQFSSSADDTFLLTWDGRINVRQLDTLLSSRDLVDPRPIELLILSACQTATGDRRASLGLAGVAIRSGARSTLATLWLVNDQATADLIAAFYQQVTQSQVTKAEALRQAQLSLLTQAQYRHPYYWAAFILIGNWL
jgi:CHAT domain-containing protein